MQVEVWLYGPLALYGDPQATIACCRKVSLNEGATLQDLLVHLALPSSERGITFINGQLSAMPGIQPDLDYPLWENDRVAIFHLKSMWPFQYRQDAATIAVFKQKDRRWHG
jgi:hypothetical protein